MFGRKPFKDVTVGEYDIPKGVSRPGLVGRRMARGTIDTVVGVSQTFMLVAPYITHRLTQYFGEDPEAFRPDRFLDSPNGNACASNSSAPAYLPFSYGPRNCIGQSAAMVSPCGLCQGCVCLTLAAAAGGDEGLHGQAHPAVPPVTTDRRVDRTRCRLVRTRDSTGRWHAVLAARSLDVASHETTYQSNLTHLTHLSLPYLGNTQSHAWQSVMVFLGVPPQWVACATLAAVVFGVYVRTLMPSVPVSRGLSVTIAGARECLCCNASCRLQAAMVLTLACNVDQGGDSGELMAAGCQLAVGHPPGYPLYVAIAHAVVHLLPAIGSPAYKLNLVASGACVCALTRAPA